MPTERDPLGVVPGRGVRIAVIDSGVHADHPHVMGVAGGVSIDGVGQVGDDYLDRIGHGTAVMAVIKEKAPAAECYAVRIFDGRLSASAPAVVAAIDWAIQARVHIVNLSLGTTNVAHVEAFSGAVGRACAAGVTLVAARDDEGTQWLPGCLPGVLQVQVDWECPRDEFRVAQDAGVEVFRASGFARPVPGVDPRRNLHGISFAVANMSGLFARAMSLAPSMSGEAVRARLQRFAAMREPLARDSAPRPPAALKGPLGRGEPASL